MLESSGLTDYEVRIGHVGVLKDILTGLGLSSEGEPEPPVATAMRLLDKGDWDGLSEFFSANGIAQTSLENLQKLASLDGGMETLDSAEVFSKN